MVETLNNVLQVIADAIMVPDIVGLILLLVISVWQFGSFLVEYVMERRKQKKANIPIMIEEIHWRDWEHMTAYVEESLLLPYHKEVLTRLTKVNDLPKASMLALAQRLLATAEARYEKVASITDMAAKLGPMLGLLGTLIPLGPGIMALSQGDTVTLSSSLSVAFNTTIAGVAVAAVCSIISNIRKRWYNDYMVTLEALMEAILEEVKVDD